MSPAPVGRRLAAGGKQLSRTNQAGDFDYDRNGARYSLRRAADNRPARRAFAGQKVAELAPDYFPLIAGAFAGPETIPGELVDDAILDRIRGA